MQMRHSVAAVVFALIALPALAHPPVSVVIDSRGNIYYSDLEQVWRHAPDGTKSVAVPNVHTHELFLDAQDNLYGEHLWYEGERTDKWGHYVWKRAANGKMSFVIPRTEGWYPKNFSFVRDGAGNMYFTDEPRKTVVRRTPGGVNETIGRGFRDVRWMTAAPNGTLFFVDDGDVVRITPDRKVTRLATKLADTSLVRAHVGKRHALQGLWTDPAGNVYVANSGQGKVVRITPAGQQRVVVESPQPWSPCGGVFARNGDLVLLEFSPTNAVRIRRTRVSGR